MFNPGDVVSFHSKLAGKVKHHLCVNINGHFLFLNSPKSKVYPADLLVDCSEISCIPATANGQSIVSCNMVVTMTDAQLRAAGARRRGVISRELLLKILTFVENTTVLSDEEKAKVLDGLGDWL